MTASDLQEDGDRPDGEFATEGSRFRTQALAGRSLSRELGDTVESSALVWMRTLRVRWPSWTSLARIRRPLRRSVPVRLQAQLSDCGPACLAMVLGFHGIDIPIEQLRRETDSGRDGVRARTLLETAQRHGLAGRGVRASLDGLRHLAPGSILFWNFKHFVVLDRVAGDWVHIMDPASGRRRIPLSDAGRMFTGVAIEFEAPLVAARRVSRGARLSLGPWRHLSHFFPRGRIWLAIAGSSLLLLLFGFATPLATAQLVNQFTHGASELGSGQSAIAILTLLAFYFALQVVRQLSLLELQTKADKRVTLGVFQHLLALPYDYFTRRSPGDLLVRVRTSTAVRQALTNSVVSTAFDGVLVFTYLALLLIADLTLATLVLFLAGLQICLLLGAWRRQTYLDADALECRVKAETELHELLAGVTTLKAGGFDLVLGEKWAHAFADELNTRVRSRRHLSLWSAASASLQFCAPLVVLAVAANQVAHGGLTVGEAVAFTALSMGVFVPLTGLVQAGLQTASLKPALVRLGDVLATDVDGDGTEEIDLSDEAGGAVEAQGVGFTYAGGAARVLEGIDLRVASGGFLAILGPSGCGKSTLAVLLAGLQTPTEGQIHFNQTSLATASRSALRRTMSFVNQDSRLFAGSIRDNIAMGSPEATDETIVAAAKTAHIHDEITAMPMRYETLLGPDGAGLSGGQRQRVALARALVRDPRVMILDEATSALDRVTEKRVLSAIVAANRTLIVITHRLAAVTGADEILLMRDGRITARGRHQELFATSTLYRDLTEIQTKPTYEIAAD